MTATYSTTMASIATKFKDVAKIVKAAGYSECKNFSALKDFYTFLSSHETAAKFVLDSEQISVDFKQKVSDYLAIKKIGKASELLVSRLPDFSDEARAKRYTKAVCNALPISIGMTFVNSKNYDKLSKEQLAKALKTIHGSEFVNDFLDFVEKVMPSKYASKNMTFDIAWILYAATASRVFPLITLRQANEDSVLAIHSLGGTYEFVKYNSLYDDDTCDIISRLKI